MLLFHCSSSKTLDLISKARGQREEKLVTHSLGLGWESTKEFFNTCIFITKIHNLAENLEMEGKITFHAINLIPLFLICLILQLYFSESSFITCFPCCHIAFE
jgi:hypothetical protein